MARYDPVRWVCQCGPENCKGTFYVHGHGTPCPLWPRCAGHKSGLEYLYFQRDPRQVRITVQDPIHYAAHQRRYKDLARAYCPEKLKAQRRRQHEREKDRERAIRARKYREEHLPGTEAPRIAVPPAPCGGDCANCPWDDCRYPTWEMDWLDGQGLALNADPNVDKAERHKARMSTDPDYAQRYRARKNAQALARRAAETPEEKETRRAKNRAYYRARRDADPEAAKAALAAKWRERVESETPEEREARLAKQREYDARRRAKETPEEREVRLAKHRAYYQAQKANRKEMET